MTFKSNSIINPSISVFYDVRHLYWMSQNERILSCSPKTIHIKISHIIIKNVSDNTQQ